MQDRTQLAITLIAIMDERHWWFASKLQETFHFGGYDNPTLLEDFLSEPEVVELINNFLAPGEPRKLFFYCDEIPTDTSGSRAPSASSRRLHIAAQLAQDVVSGGRVCLYVLRRDIGGEVDVSQMEKELFCGEIRHSVLSSLASVLTEAYAPLLHSQKNWGECTKDNTTNFLQNFDKFSGMLTEMATQVQINQSQLQQPARELWSDLLQQHGKGPLLGEVLVECEALMADWISTTESLLIETTDERLEDPQGSLLAELGKWRRRQTLLSSLVEQLKTKECRMVIAALAAAKSKLLKKWKNIDLQITDAFNTACDRVHYLDMLSPYLEALEAPSSSPHTLISSILPALTTTVKRNEGQSRVYAHSGYLGILFTKISNALVRVCMSGLQNYTCRDRKDHFWEMAFEAVLSEARQSSPFSSSNHPLIAKLNSCIQLCTAFKELLQQLKDCLLQQQHVSFGVSNPSLSTTVSHVSLLGRKASNPSRNPSSVLVKKASLPSNRCSGEIEAVDNGSTVLSSPSGISLQNVDKITVGLSDFSQRVSKVLEIISTLSQFKQLQGNIRGLPRISGLWDVDEEVGEERGEDGVGDEPLPVGSGVKVESLKEGGEEEKAGTGDAGMVVGRGRLSTLKEESLVMDRGTTEEGQSSTTTHTSSSSSMTNPSSGSLHLSAPSHLHSDHPGDSVALRVKTTLERIQNRLELACHRGIPDVFGTSSRYKTTFTSAYEEYSLQIATLEENICAYLKAVFAGLTTSGRALDMISRFDAVSSRVELRETFRRSKMEAFGKYSQELEEIQRNYEQNKGSPPLPRNIPPVAGAVAWVRQLLRRVEGPMEIFRNDTTVMQSVESLHVCKLYNRLSTALLKYEALWLGQWRSSLKQTRAGLKATLLVQEEEEKGGGASRRPHIRVNAHNRLLELVAESKALVRLGVSIPDSARTVQEQEFRLKHFKEQLEDILGRFYSVQEAVDPAIRPLMAPHIETVVRSLLPGWTTLTWNTLNIDAFLHRVQTSLASLLALVERTGDILKGTIHRILGEMQGASLFDVELATGRVWHPHEFSVAMATSIGDRSTKLLADIATVRSAVMEIISLASSSSPSSSSTPLSSHPYHQLTFPRGPQNTAAADLRKAPTIKGSNKNSPQHESHSITLSGSSAGATKPSHVAVGAVSETGEKVLSHFCELVFEAVGNLVQRSHSQLCSTLCDSSTVLVGQHATGPVDPGSFSKEDKDKETEGSGESKIVSFQEPEIKEPPFYGPTKAVCPSPADPRPPSLQLVVHVHFLTPRIHLDPTLEEVHSHLAHVSSTMVNVLHQITWWVEPYTSRSLHNDFEEKGTVESIQTSILHAIQAQGPGIGACLRPLQEFDSLWKLDLHVSYQRFLEGCPSQRDCSTQVERFMEIEKKIAAIPAVFHVGLLQLATDPVKNSLRALAGTWKTEFVSFLHKQAKTSLSSLVTSREKMRAQLVAPVETLAQLKTTLELLQEISDLQNTIDGLYLPVEELYTLLRSYSPHLPRSEVQQVDALREEWTTLTELADNVQHRLLSEQRLSYEREVDKQVKAFVVKTIQFRNSFDTEGPLVPGLLPSEAVSRLGSFLERCEELKSECLLLESVQSLLTIAVTPYPELDQTEQDLSFLRALYSNYQQFIEFDKRFRQELWAEVNLDSAIQEVAGFWYAYRSLPVEQQEWDASQKLRSEICQYQELLPLLKKLHSREVRNRHWLQVMEVTNCNLQLEGSVFKMTHLLDAGLLLHATAIEEIVRCARCELELEEQFYSIEEEWNEQVLQFSPYKSRGPLLLAGDHTLSLLERLEHAQTQLATMLMSRHILPLREETSQWAIKLASIAEVLQQWLSVQELWHNLEAVFGDPSTATEFPEEAIRFAAIDDRWGRIMQRAYETRNAMQCCLGGEVPKSEVLSSIYRELEDCKKSLSSYLLSKRQAFPRFYYVSDDSLLSILSSPSSTHTLQPHLRSLFAAVTNIVASSPQEGETPVITAVESPEGEVLQLEIPVPLSDGVELWISSLLSSLRSSLHKLLMSAITHDRGSFSLEECAHHNITQVATMALFFHWAKECELALSQCRYDRRALPGARGKFSAWSVGKLSSLLMRHTWRTSEEPITPLHRLRLEAMTTLSLWLRDILDDLCHRKLRDAGDFEWQRFLRPSLRPTEGGHTHQLVLQCLEQELMYGCEFLGCQPPPVFTPRTDNYIIALTQAMSAHVGSVVDGPTSSGKVQLIKGIGLLCGRFVSTFHCSALMEKATIARIFEGLAQDGSWACFSDVHTLPTSSLSVLSQMMHTISVALQSQQSFCQLPCGRKVPLHSELAVFLTHTTTAPPAHEWQIPPTLSPLFRPFSLALPDSVTVLRASCMALGLRGPKALTNKLVMLQRMAREQLSSSSAQAHLSVSSLRHVLEVASRRLAEVRRTRQTPERAPGGPSSTTELHGGTHHHTQGHSPSHDAKLRKPSSSFMLSPSAGQPLSPLALREHTLVAQLLLGLIGPRFADQELPVFVSMVRDVFAGSPEVAGMQVSPLLVGGGGSSVTGGVPMTSSSIQDFTAVAAQLKEQALSAGLTAAEPWISKVEQLFTMTQLKHAVLLVGQPATGKTSALQTVVSILNTSSTSDGGTHTFVKLLRIFPMVSGDLSELYGHVNPSSGDWVDGVFTSNFRKAHKATQAVTWICLDGPLHSSWVHPLSGLLGRSKVMTLSNGETLVMSGRSLKLVLESGTLEDAAPPTLANCGIVYFDSSVLGWRPLVQSWLATRSPHEAQCLQKHFDCLMDPIVEFVLKSGSGAVYSEVGLLGSCLAYLTTLLNTYAETAEVFSEVHVERLLLFALIWSYGGVLLADRYRFSQLLKTLTNSMPDDSEYSVFDYYVDESGEWDVWQTRVPEQPTPQVDLTGSVFVDTPDTVCVEVLLELALAASRHMLLVGPHGSGKTTLCKHFLHGRALNFGSTEMTRQVVFNGRSSSSSLHRLMQVYFHHRQGYTYGPKHGRRLELFVDDLHLPLRHSSAAYTAHEYLRQLMDSRGLYNLQKQNDWCAIEDLVLFASLTSNTGTTLAPRLQSHFAVIQIPDLRDHTLKRVTSEMIHSFLPTDVHPDTVQGVLGASIEAYTAVKQVLKVSDMPGRQHYFFSLAKLESIFQGMCHSLDALGGCDKGVAFGWCHEVKRVFMEGLCRVSDLEWIEGCINTLGDKFLSLSDGGEERPLALSAIPTEIRQGEEHPVSTVSPLSTLPEVRLQPLERWGDVSMAVGHYLTRYREDCGPLQLDFSTDTLKTLVQLHRTLKCPRGNCILVGSLGQPLEPLVRFALYLAGYSLQPLDTRGTAAFNDGLRTLLRQTGLEGKPTAIIVEDENLASVEVLQMLNSLVASGELPSLFSNDEMDGLLQALSPCIKRDFPSEETDPMQYFTARIFRNLRIVFCLSPTSPLLTHQAHDFKGLLQGCHLIWMGDWTEESLNNTVEHFFSRSPLAVEIEEEIRAPLCVCLSAIHRYLMRETGQLLQAGLQPNHLQPYGTPSHPQPPPTPTTQTQAVSQPPPPPPPSFECLMEKVLRLESEMGGHSVGTKLPYVGPRTFQQFLECFCVIFKKKSSEAAMGKNNLSKALETLHNTQHEVDTMKTTLSELKKRHEEASKLSGTLLSDLTSKSCQLERLKALLGHGSSVLSAMQVVGEQQRLLAENEEDDEELLAVFVDRQSSRLELLLHRAREQLVVAEREERETKLAMNKTKEEALHWQSKIDRNMIDQIKSLNNPPRLVGTIMELMFTLLHQYGTGTEQGTEVPLGGSSSSTPGHPLPTKKRPPGGVNTSSMSTDSSKMEKEQWIAIQLAIGDSQKFLDLLNGLKWENGLSPDAVNLIESRLATSHTNPAAAERSSSVPSTADSTGSHQPSRITVSMARHAAESAATMCGFAVAIVEYHYSFKPYRLAVEKLQRAREELHGLESSMDNTGALLRGASEMPHKSEPPELEDVEEEAEAGEEGVERLCSELVELQGRVDKAIMEKHALGKTCQQLAEKLKSANNLLESLKQRKELCESRLGSLPPPEVLVANCILAAAFTVYCGPLSTNTRHRVFNALVGLCQSCGLPSSSEHPLISLSSYPSFMLGEPALYHLVMEGLPQDSSNQQNACIISHPHTGVWPLVVDPLGMVEQWLKGREREATMVEYKSPTLSSTLLKCLQAGTPLVITAIDTIKLTENKLMMDMLQCRSALHNARGGQKMMIGDKEVECNPSFRLYLVTSDAVPNIPPSVFSLVCVVVFHPEQGGLRELLLDSFLLVQNPKTSHDKELLREEIHDHVVQLHSVETELLQLLASQEHPTEDPTLTRRILTLNKNHEETQESLARLLASYSTMNEIHLASLRTLASQAGVMMDVVCAMGSILPAYHTSYHYAKAVFLSFIEQAGSHIQSEEAPLRMTYTAYAHFNRGYFEKDRLLFSLTVALEIEISRGRATRDECRFFISPFVGKQFAVKGLSVDPSLDARGAVAVSFGKKPFDWMTDTQWQMLLMVSSHFGWIHEVLERMGKDGKETIWRTVGEGVAPETINLAEGIGCKLLPLQQLLILRAMRPERITQCVISFITSVIQHKQRKLNYDAPTELHSVMRACRGDQVPLILYRDEPTLPPAKVRLLAAKAKAPVDIIFLHGNGEEEIEAARQSMETASSQGHWLLLHNIHTCPQLLSQLPSLLQELPQCKREGWKLWLSAFVGEEENYIHRHLLPLPLLQSACKVVLDPPKSIRASVLHSLTEMAGDIVSCSSRPEWLPLLHHVAMLHATVQLRRSTYPQAWAKEYPWKHTQLTDTLHYMMRELQSTEVVQPGIGGLKPISWSGIRHMISEVYYGSLVTDPTDAFVFAALTEHWIHPGGPKREVGRYHIPSQFLTPGTRLSTLVQAVEGTSPPLIFTAEICGLYYTPLIQLGCEDYLFPNLAALSFQLNQHSIPPPLPAPPQQDLPSHGKATLFASNLTTAPAVHPSPSVLVEKLPSFIQVTSQISEVVLTAVPKSLLLAVGQDVGLLQALPVRTTAERLAENIPCGWRKEVLQERLRRHGVDSPFGHFLKNETSRMALCLHKIHSSLQELQTVLSDSSKGDTLLGSPHLVDLTLSLLSLRVPHDWWELVGPSSPPLNWPLREWVQDLVLRFTFLDRLLTGGMAKTPTYWLGAFFNPQAFLSVLQQHVMKSLCVKSGAVEQFSYHAELTNRDKDHIRDPPPEGELFIYGVHLWGCGYEKTATLELQDIPPKSQVPTPLPLLHLSVAPKTEQQLSSGPSGDSSKGPFIFQCPCFVSHMTRTQNSSALFTIEVSSSDVTPQKWATRNLACTLRPF